MSAREGLATTEKDISITVIGPKGLKDRLSQSFCFMGRMRYLRPIELTQEDANKPE